MRVARLIAALAAVPLLAGCAGHVHTRTGPVVVVVPAGHVHTARCGHYRHGANWYYWKGHKHGKRCGHVHVDGVWIVR